VVASSVPQKTVDKGVLILAVLHLRLMVRMVWILVVRILVVRMLVVQMLVVQMLVVRMLVVLSLEAHPALPSKALAHGIDWPSSSPAGAPLQKNRTLYFYVLCGLGNSFPAAQLSSACEAWSYVSSCHRLDLQRLDRWCSGPKCGRETELYHAHGR
jgi:hypothetical protein